MTALRSPLRDLLAGIPVDVETDLASMAEAAFDPARQYRYALTRIWDARTTRLPWIMANPSKADAFQLDPTVTRCIDFTRRYGYGGLIVLNRAALRATDPRKLRDHPAPIGPHNADVIRAVLASLDWRKPADVVCAWGALVPPAESAQLVQLIRDTGHTPVCLGRTGRGQPRHPLYVAGKTPLEPM